MASRGKIAYRCRTRKKVWVKKKGSDESDEDYMVGEEDGPDQSDGEKHSIVSDDESEKSLGEYEEEEEEDDRELEGVLVKKKIKKVSRPRGRKGFQGRNNNGIAKPRKKKAAYSEEEAWVKKKVSDESDEDYMVGEEDGLDQSEGEKHSIVSDDESEESLGEYEEEEEDDRELEEDLGKKKIKRVTGPRGRNGFQGRNNNGIAKPRKKKAAYSEQEVWVKKKGSDESDEDYMVGEEDGLDQSEGEKHSIVSDDESEKSLGEYEEEEEEDDRELEEDLGKKKIKKVSGHRGRKGFPGRNNNGIAKPRKKKAAYSEEENQDDDNFNGAKRRKKSKLSQDEEEDDGGDIQLWHEQEKPRNKTQVSSADYIEKRKKRRKASYREEKGDDDSDYNINEEFVPDNDKELLVTKRNRVSRLDRQAAAQIAKGQKRNINSKVVKRTMRRKLRTQQVIRRRDRPDSSKEFRYQNRISRNDKRIIRQVRGRRKKSSVDSDSNFLCSGSSDKDYTISEEEREQVREATEFCRKLTSSLRNNNVLEVISEKEVAPSERKLPGKKGKEKLEDMTIEVGKQVCGICLSEEGKRTVTGILNCCSHYFCFACIMEWSKVESRCPLCKKRFATISRTARIDGKFNLRDAAIPVPKQDQVYQPSEEELRSYLDPYENVICTKCQQGGDDALMLLCDLCDSPAHTYCVGLVHEVPEGNWYCDDCKSTILGSSNAQAMNPTSDHGADYNLAVVSSPGVTVRETFNLGELYVPDTPFTEVPGHSSSPRHSIGDSQAASPSSGSAAFTLYERRLIQRQIHLLNYRSRHSDRSDVVAQVSGSSPFGSQIRQEGVMAPQQTVTLSRQEGVMAPQQTVTPSRIEQQNVYHQGRLPNRSNTFLNGREALFPRMSNLRGQILDNEASASRDHSLNGLPCNEYIGINLMIGRGLSNQQSHPCSSRLAWGPDARVSSRQSRELSYSPLEKELVQTMVKRHLKSLSRDMEIGYRGFKDIARTSTHTVLAAVGLEHRQKEVYPVRTRPLSCDHFDSRHACPIRGQCSSCFDWFVRNVVREIMYSRVSVMPMRQA